MLRNHESTIDSILAVLTPNEFLAQTETRFNRCFMLGDAQCVRSPSLSQKRDYFVFLLILCYGSLLFCYVHFLLLRFCAVVVVAVLVFFCIQNLRTCYYQTKVDSASILLPKVYHQKLVMQPQFQFLAVECAHF